MPSGAGLVPLGKGICLFKEDGREGFEDFLEIDEFKYNTTVENVEKDSNRTSEVKTIMSAVRKTKVTGSIIVAATPLELERFFALTDSVQDVSQISGTLVDASYTARLNKWIDLGKVKLSALKVLDNGVSCTPVNGDDKFTANLHGMENGQKIEFTATTLPTNISADTTYYVVNKAANDFQVSTSLGGLPVDFTTDGVAVKFHKIFNSGTDYEINADHGWLFVVASGSIVDASTILVSASYAAQAMQKIEALKKSTIKGTVIFLGDPIEGPRYKWEAYVKIAPEGDFAMLSQDPSTMQINFECLESAARVAQGQGLYTKIDISGLSKAIDAVA